MRPMEQWIWLPKDKFPNNQTTHYSERTHRNRETNYTVAAFERTYRFPAAISEVQVRTMPVKCFAHSHGRAGTPAWSLPLALSGLEILEPGFKKIRLNPSLLGLTYAHVQISTPYGMIEVKMQDGTEPEVTVPDGILREK